MTKSNSCKSTSGDVLFEYVDGEFWDSEGGLWKSILDYIDREREKYWGTGTCPHFSFDLSAAATHETPLEGIPLTAENLENSTFEGTDLWGACFADSNLTRVNFRRCILCDSTLSRAILCEADLSGANLGVSKIGLGADLCGADLTNANLTDATLWGTAYDAQTIFPSDFIIPDSMIFRHPGESHKDFRDRQYTFKDKLIQEGKYTIL